MVLCLIALPIFAFLGIFSVKYRKLTREALDCLFRTVTLKKCQSGLDGRIKTDVTKTFLKFSPPLAKLVYKNYKVVSWIFLIILLWSVYAGGIGAYNYVLYGNCNGPSEVGFCVFDPTGVNSGCSEADVDKPDNIVLPTIDADDPIIGNPDAELTIIEFGCYTCPYTSKTEPTVKKILEYYDGRVNLQFKTFEIPGPLSHQSVLSANCAFEQGKYSGYHEELMNLGPEVKTGDFVKIADRLDLNMTQFNSCMSEDKYKEEIAQDKLQGIKAGVHGTPTFFIGDEMIVGSKPLRTFKNIIDSALEDLNK